eukprot:CAMPEP_0177603776 /NCGR_PEP_ID=MMETSP0419_2-20121207/15720_1 /TAXON_ID=582737 /ORGANISM="Tetraselmis sp., Strain GSL018" /LENGTH=483 /DNA_ID=CAMNT_0019097625 /DNA_START=116 /DNA_END=1567 /DNA_ORIENTATION=+
MGSTTLGVPATIQSARHIFGFFGAPEPSGPPLTEPLPDILAPSPAYLETGPPGTQLTTLSSGVRVATEATWGPTTALGVYVDAGSIYENETNAGVSHLLEQMAFKGTEHRTFFRVVRETEAFGGNVFASSSREQMGYNVDCVRTNTAEAVELLLDAVLKPKFQPWDLKAQADKIHAELMQLSKNPAFILQEGLHCTAYEGGLGRPLVLTPEALHRLTPEVMEEFVAEHFTGPRIVLSGSGVEHSELVSLAQDMLADIPRNPPSGKPVPKVPSRYVGGEFRHPALDSPQSTVVLAFEFAGGWKDVKGSVDVTVMQYLLGGGSSFSAGGPGKGMHSRLFRNILNGNPWITNCQALGSLFNETGLVGITCTFESAAVQHIVPALSEQLIAIAQGVPEDELERAKRAAASSVLMNLESKDVVCEDIGRQVLTYGHRKSAAEFVEAIRNVTVADLQRTMSKILKTPPTVAVHGNTRGVPRYDDICNMF